MHENGVLRFESEEALMERFVDGVDGNLGFEVLGSESLKLDWKKLDLRV